MKPSRPTSSRTASYYHSSTGGQSPHTQHIVGIGDAGIGLARGFFRVGETEDMLEDPRARLSMLAIDIEDAAQESGAQLEPFREERIEFLHRLEDRGIPPERADITVRSLEVPDRDDLMETLRNYDNYLRREYPARGDDPDYKPWLPEDMETLLDVLDSEGRHPIGTTDQQMGELKDVYAPRAVAKAIYGHHYYNTGILAEDLDEFAESVQATELPSLVFGGFGVGGGTGSGMIVDLSRHLVTERLGREYPYIGLGVLPNTRGDDPERHRGAGIYTTLNELDCLVDKEKNQGIVDVWGELYRNPFTGGLMLVPTAHVMDRVGYYTEATRDFSAHWLKQGRKFIADSSAKYLTRDQSRYFYNAMKSGPQSELAAPHEKVPKYERSLNMMAICKFAHPGVQKIPGDSNEEYREDYRRSIRMVREKIGLPEEFTTNYIDVSVAAPRWVWTEGLTEELVDELSPWVENGADDMTIDVIEAFDTLTAYAQILFSGVAKTDLDFYEESREMYDALSEDEKVLHHSLLLENGVVLSEPSAVEGKAGKGLWDSGAWVDVPYEAVRGTGEVRPDVMTIMKETADAVERARTSTAEADD